MFQAALEANIDPIRLSFVHTIEVVQNAASDFHLAALQYLAKASSRDSPDITIVRLSCPLVL